MIPQRRLDDGDRGVNEGVDGGGTNEREREEKDGHRGRWEGDGR